MDSIVNTELSFLISYVYLFKKSEFDHNYFEKCFW